MEAIIYEKNNHIAKITFNQPERRNVMSAELLRDFSEAVQDVKKDPNLRVLVITGKGKAFCAGVDLRTLQDIIQKSDYLGIAGMRDGLIRIYNSFLQTLQIEIPTIASINGYAIGGGLGLALCCDIRIAAGAAKFAANFAQIGIHPGMAITYMLPRLVGISKACNLLFTGRMIDANEAEKIGLVDKVVTQDNLEEETQKLAESITSSAPYIVKLTKKAIYRGLGFDPNFSIELEASLQTICAQMQDAQEGLQAFFQKRKPEFKGK